MSKSRLIEAATVAALFLAYLALWHFKRRRDIQRTGVDPDVLRRAATPIQEYFARLVWLMTAFVVAILGLHVFAPEAWPPLSRAEFFDHWWCDLLGGVLGATGLGICALAQATMGTSWRVGIDNRQRADLITGGIFRWIRNPTYVGLHLVNVGLWLIWPTTLVASYVLLFFVVMDIQVRCEEEFLATAHGDDYRAYVARTWRYVPLIY